MMAYAVAVGSAAARRQTGRLSVRLDTHGGRFVKGLNLATI